MYKGITRNEWDLMFEDGCSKQSNFRAQRFSSKVNEERERDSYLVILTYLKLLYFFLSITKTFIPKESSKANRKSKIEKYDKRTYFGY